MMRMLVAVLAVVTISLPTTKALHPSFTSSLLPVIVPSIIGGGSIVNISDPASVASFISTILDALPGKSVNVSWACYNDTVMWLGDILQGKLYAVEMLDAVAKIPAAISKGHILWMGGYDMCLAARRNVTHIEFDDQGKNRTWSEMVPAAKYCMVRLDSPLLRALPVLPAFATCLPASCTAKDADELLLGIIHILNAAAGVSAGSGARSTVCSDEEIPAQGGTTTTLILIGIMAIACIWCTIIHFLCRLFDKRWWNIEDMNETALAALPVRKSKKLAEGDNKGYLSEERPVNEDTANAETSFAQSSEPTSSKSTEAQKLGRNKYPIFMKLVLCFSIIHNTNKIFAPAAPGQLKYLDGMRVISMWWVILGHIYMLGQSFFNNQYEMVDHLKGVLQQIPLNGYFAIDTFFFLSGLVVVYTLLKEVERTKSSWPFLFSYAKRFWRLTPLYMTVLLVYMYIVPYIAGGPYTLVVKQEGSPTEFCKQYWWTNLAYINNLYPLDKNQMCMEWAWFLGADMQLFIITPIILLIVIKFPKVGMAIMGVIIAACAATLAALVSMYGLPLTVSQLHDPLPAAYKYDDTFEYIYDKPYSGGIPYFVGAMLAVYMVRLRSKNHRWHLFELIPGWIASTAAGICCVLGLYMGGLENKTDMTLGERITYAALTKLAWSLSLAWVVYACQYGYGAVVRSFLSLRLWTVLSRLTYAAFLVHFLIMQMYFTALRTMLGYSGYQVISIFWSQVVSVYIVAYIASVFIEMPLRNIEKLLWFHRV